MYIKYDIQETDTFDETRYSHVASELASLASRTSDMDSTNKSAIIISYLKDHSIRVDWLKNDNQLTQAITSRSYDTSHIEALFEGCRNHKVFLHDFEDYITTQIRKSELR